MLRSFELLKTILMFMQNDSEPTQCCKDIEKGVGGVAEHSWPEVRLHLALLKDSGLVTECSTPAEYRLTSAGYDVIESADPVEDLRSRARSLGGAAASSVIGQGESRHPLPPALRSSRAS